MELFITAAVRTSNLTLNYWLSYCVMRFSASAISTSSKTMVADVFFFHMQIRIA
jgi:hypothetical protein